MFNSEKAEAPKKKVLYMRRVETLGEDSDVIESVLEEEVNPDRLWEIAPFMLTVEEAASLLDVGLNLMYRLVKRDDFPAIKIGHKYKIPKDMLRDWFFNLARNRAEIS